MQLKDKVIIITGASSGIGLELAMQLGRKGAKVVLAARSAGAIADAAALINKDGGSAAAFPVDVSKRDQVERLVTSVLERYGRLDAFIANAGITHPSEDLTDLAESDIRAVMETNFMGCVYAVWAAAPALENGGGGQLVFVSSVVGKRGIPRNSGYCASKFAVQGLTESIRPELKKKNIHVLTVCPPGVDTPFFKNNKRDVARSYKLHSVARIARMIIQAMERDKREVWLTKDTKFLVWANILFPGLLDWAISAYKGEKE